MASFRTLAVALLCVVALASMALIGGALPAAARISGEGEVSSTVSGTAAALVVAENTAATVPLATYTDSREGTTWAALTGADASLFAISAAGVLTFDATALTDGPDYENPVDADKDNVYHVTVRSAGAETLEYPVTVTVTNIGPTISGRPDHQR
jgi:hypothetical protein